MNREPTRPAVPGNEDSWESLAEDLFGIEFHKTPDAAHVIPPDELSLEEPAEADGAETDSSQPPGTPDQAASTPSADDSRSGEEAQATDELRPPDKLPAGVDEPITAVAQESSSESDRGEEQQNASPAEESGTVDGTSDEDDGYWDALNEWDWNNSDESPPTEERRKPASRSRTERTSRPRSATSPLDQSVVASRDDSTVADFRDEYVHDGGFSAGLLEDEDRPDVASPPVPRQEASSAQPSAAARVADEEEDVSDGSRSTPAGTSSQAEAEPEVRKRRRRGPRRSRSAERKPPDAESAQSGPAEETRDALEKAGEDESAETSEFSEPPKGGEVSGEESERPKRPARRRRPRRRKKSETIESPERDHSPDLSDEEQLADTDDDQGDDDEDLDESSEESTPAYRNVPTWEQAISYLLHPEQRESKSSKAHGRAHSRSKTGSKPKGGGSKTGERRSRRRR